MAKVTDELLDHEYDGIREFDNPTPAWWNWLFFLSFLFSVVYFYHYHLGSGQGVIASYEKEMTEFRAMEAKRDAEERASMSEEKLAALMNDKTALTEGQAVYQKFCVSCHAPQGQGLVGPNLTDEYWLHGDASLVAIRKVVAAGVDGKGMPGWGKVLSKEDLMKVVAYVGTLRGTNVKGKDPQGEKVGGPTAGLQ